jgi:hypothetical protein
VCRSVLEGIGHKTFRDRFIGEKERREEDSLLQMDIKYIPFPILTEPHLFWDTAHHTERENNGNLHYYCMQDTQV